MNKEPNPPPTGNIESESTPQSGVEAQTDSALQTEQTTTALEDQASPPTRNTEHKPISETSAEARTDLALQTEQAITAQLDQKLQTESVEDKTASESEAEVRTDSPLQIEQSIIAPTEQESSQTENVEDKTASESDAEPHTDLALQSEQVVTAPMNQDPLQTEKVESKSTLESRPEPPDSAPQTSKLPLHLENWVPIISIIVAILTFVAIAVQAWIYDQQRTIMSMQVNNAQKNFQLTERAYVGVASLEVDLAKGEIVVWLENVGRKPAKAITMIAGAYHTGPIEFKKGAKKNFKAGDVTLFPGSFKMRVVVPMPEVSPQEIKAISENTQFLYVYGKIWYDDGFGSTDSTTFAFKYSLSPREGWDAVGISVENLEESLISEVDRLSLNNRITIDPPSFERSRKLSPPTYIPSPLGYTPSASAYTPSASANTPSASANTPSASANTPSPPAYSPLPAATAFNMGTPDLTRKGVSESSKCACSCRITCGNACEFECSNCSLREGAEVARVCCQKALESVGEMPPCPGKN